MKFLIDNNLSFKLIQPLQPSFQGSLHISNALSIYADDHEIWQYCKENGFVILSKDNDFDELSQLLGCPPKVVHLLCGNQTTLFILNLILSNSKDIISFYENEKENCLLKIFV